MSTTVLPRHWWCQLSCHTYRLMGLCHVAPSKREKGGFLFLFLHAFPLLKYFSLPRRFITKGSNYQRFALSTCFTLHHSLRVAYRRTAACRTAGLWICRTWGMQDHGTAGLRDYKTCGMRDRGNAGLQDCKIAVLQDRQDVRLEDCGTVISWDCGICCARGHPMCSSFISKQ